MLEDYVHKHYDPIEYHTAFKVFGELKPALKSYLDNHVHILEHDMSMRRKKQSYKQLDEYLRTHSLLLGDTLTNMYSNIITCLSKIYFPNERSNKLPK